MRSVWGWPVKCQRCGHDDACWLDTYRDEAVCNTCGDRTNEYGMAFLEPLRLSDTRRLSTYAQPDNPGGDR